MEEVEKVIYWLDRCSQPKPDCHGCPYIQDCNQLTADAGRLLRDAVHKRMAELGIE